MTQQKNKPASKPKRKLPAAMLANMERMRAGKPLIKGPAK